MSHFKATTPCAASENIKNSSARSVRFKRGLANTALVLGSATITAAAITVGALAFRAAVDPILNLPTSSSHSIEMGK